MSEGLLLDTHVWVWMSSQPHKLKQEVRERIADAASSSHLYVSAISLFEVANLVLRNRILLSHPFPAWLELNLGEPGVIPLPVTPNIAVVNTTLPADFHRDPNDRLIAATAIAHNLTLCTHDGHLLRFGSQGIYNFLEV